MGKGTDIAQVDAGLAAIEPTPALLEAAYASITEKTLPPEIGDPKVTARLIAERIRRGTFEESLDPTAKLPAWSDLYLDRVVLVRGFHLNPSSFVDDEGAKGVYAVCELGLPDGSIDTVTCGGQNVLMQLVKAWEEGAYPFQAVLIENPTSTPGRTTLWLKRPEKAPESAAA